MQQQENALHEQTNICTTFSMCKALNCQCSANELACKRAVLQKDYSLIEINIAIAIGSRLPIGTYAKNLFDCNQEIMARLGQLTCTVRACGDHLTWVALANRIEAYQVILVTGATAQIFVHERRNVRQSQVFPVTRLSFEMQNISWHK